MHVTNRVLAVYEEHGLTGVARSGLRKICSGLHKIFWELYSPFASLKQLGRRRGTDKGNRDHTFRGVSYLDVYDNYFRPLKRKHINLLEIGVHRGASLRLWKDYFPKAQIYGLDINPLCAKHDEDRIEIVIGSQTDEVALQSLCETAGGFDIIVDDGSHVNKHILTSFEYLFPSLKPGGLYMIEDLGCTYEPLEEGNVREKWPGMVYNDPAENLNNDREEMNRFFLKLMDDLDHSSGDVLSVEFWSNLCCIRKAGNGLHP